MPWKREIKSYHTSYDRLADELTVQNLFTIARSKFSDGYYLAHTIEGVMWGTLSQLEHIALDILTDLRVFNTDQQLYVWRNGDIWQSWYVRDNAENGKAIQAFDEHHILWGTSTEQREYGIELVEGAQGFRQQIPIYTTLPEFDNQNPLTERVVMNIRHYLDQHDNGMNYVAFSRITKLKSYDYLKDPDNKTGDN